MTREIVTEAGFYNGRFLKPGASYETADGEREAPRLDRMKKEDLLVFAKERSIEVDSSKTSAEIIAAIEAAV